MLVHRGPDHHAEARECFERVAAFGREIGVRTLSAHAALGLGRVAGLSGDRAERDRQLREAERAFRELGLGRYAARAERWLADGEVSLAESA